MGNLNATNPRDTVYAFLAFSDSEDAARIAPSYQLAVHQVYCDAAYRSIRSIKSLDVLELAVKSRELATHNDNFSKGITSWVPDFGAPLPSLPFMTHNVGSTDFNASRKCLEKKPVLVPADRHNKRLHNPPRPRPCDQQDQINSSNRFHSRQAFRSTARPFQTCRCCGLAPFTDKIYNSCQALNNRIRNESPPQPLRTRRRPR